MSDAKHAWVTRVLGLDYLDLARPQPPVEQRDSEATTMGALALETRERPAQATDTSIADLAVLHKQAQALRNSLSAYSTPDPDAVGDEWSGVTSICDGVGKLLNKVELRAGDIEAANNLLATADQAKAAAKGKIQIRLEQEAEPMRQGAAKAAMPDPDAKGTEWSSVVTACEGITDALPAGKLIKAGVQTAADATAKLPNVLATARNAIQLRLANQAKLIRDQVAGLVAIDPEARGDEWTPVKDAANAVEASLPAAGLHNADIDAANDRLLHLTDARNHARAAIQTRLQNEVQSIRNQVTPYRTAHAEAIGAEWGRVIKACDAAEAALPTGTLTAAALLPGAALLKRIPVVVGVVVSGIQARLRKERIAVINALKPYETVEPGGEGKWDTITPTCQTVRDAMPLDGLTGAAVTEGRRRLMQDVVPAADPVLQDMWKADVVALRKRISTAAADAVGNAGRNSNLFKGLQAFLQTDPAVAAVTTATGTFTPMDLAAYRQHKADATQKADAACAKIGALKAAIGKAGLVAESEAGLVTAALVDANRQHLAIFGLEQLQQRGKAEAEAITAAKVKADERLAFRTVVADADTAMKKASAGLQRLAEGLADDMKDWVKHAGFLQKAQAGTLTEPELTNALAVLASWGTALDTRVAQRQGHEVTVRTMTVTYGGSTGPSTLDQLEAVRDAVARQLGSAKAQAIRNNLSQGGNYPLAAWTKALDEALTKQVETQVAGTEWAKRFDMGHDTGASWGINNTGDVGGYATHITLYPGKVSASHAGTPAEIVDAIIGRDVSGIHVTQERYGADNQNNPHVYIGTRRNMAGTPAGTAASMEKILTDYVATLAPIAKKWKDRKGLTPEQVTANEAYLRTIETEIDALS